MQQYALGLGDSMTHTNMHDIEIRKNIKKSKETMRKRYPNFRHPIIQSLALLSINLVEVGAHAKVETTMDPCPQAKPPEPLQLETEGVSGKAQQELSLYGGDKTGEIGNHFNYKEMSNMLHNELLVPDKARAFVRDVPLHPFTRPGCIRIPI